MSAETPTWIVTETSEDGWIKVQPNYHDQLTPEPGQEITLAQEPDRGAECHER